MAYRYRLRQAHLIPKKRRVRRECLRCGGKFVADGRFNRICPECTVKNRYILDEYHESSFVEY